jgi:hypothetical protein
MPSPSAGDPGKRIAHEGKHRHYWVTALANPQAPTVTELQAGFDFSRYVPKDGATFDPTENYIESHDVTEVFDAQQVGSWGEQATLTMYRQDPDDDAFNYWSYGDVGYWVDVWNADTSSPKDGDLCTVRYVEVHEPKPLPAAANEKQKFQMGTANLQAPIYDAVVSGS